MKIYEAVILLEGMGTRLLPLTKTISKEMLPIYDVPTVFLLVEEAYKSGIKKYFLLKINYLSMIMMNTIFLIHYYIFQMKLKVLNILEIILTLVRKQDLLKLVYIML